MTKDNWHFENLAINSQFLLAGQCSVKMSSMELVELAKGSGRDHRIAFAILQC